MLFPPMEQSEKIVHFSVEDSTQTGWLFSTVADSSQMQVMGWERCWSYLNAIGSEIISLFKT